MKEDLTAGEFASMTGLSAKALRLYAERGILNPASVDAESRYRYYARSQLRHGLTLDLLRRAQVPLSELVSASDFSFERWRQTVQLKRHFEDFFLAVAEHITTFDPADFTAHSCPTPAVDWVGVLIDLDIPEDAEGRIETFTGLAVDMPAVDSALDEALADLGVGHADMRWTAVPDTAVGSRGGQMLLARSGPARLDEASREFIAGQVRSRTGRDAIALTGTLPRRIEVTFTTAATRDLTPVEEAASGYLHVLAFEDHITRHQLTAISTMARQVSHSTSMFSTNGEPISVFDVHPPVREDASC